MYLLFGPCKGWKKLVYEWYNMPAYEIPKASNNSIINILYHLFKAVSFLEGLGFDSGNFLCSRGVKNPQILKSKHM